MKPHLAAVIAIALTFARPVFAETEDVVTIDSRPGVTIGMIVTKPAGEPSAAAILFAGGSGKLGLWRGNGTRSHNFLVRSRALFAARGVLAVTVDVPSDKRSGGVDGLRGSPEYRADIAAVLRWVRARTAAPVWLIGTSRGTIAVGHLAGALPVDGAVFTATVLKKSRRRPPTALDGNLEGIRVPVLVVHHKADGCVVTPPDRLGRLTRRLTGAAKVETLLFMGGKPAESDDCGARSAHGFFGIEDKVTDAIVAWMRANARH